MAIHIFVLSFITVLCVNGQFFEPQYGIDITPLQFRGRHSSMKFEIQPSVSREIEYPSPEITRNSNQGRRHIENHQRGNIQNVQNNKNINDFRPKPYESVYQNNNENVARVSGDAQFNRNSGQLNYDSQLAQIQQQNPGRENTQNRHQKNKNIGVITPITAYDINNLRTNGNPRINQNTQPPSQYNSFQENAYRHDNVKTNLNSNQEQDTRLYDISRLESSTRTYNNPSNDNLRTNKNPNYQQNNNGNKNNDCRNAETSTVPIVKINCNGQNVDSMINRNNENRHDPTKPSNSNNENNRRTTEPGRRIIVGGRKVIGGTKLTQDNELSSKTNGGRTMDQDHLVWNGSETSSAKTTIVPLVDDRASFDGGKCPTGQVKFNNMCVDKD